MHLHTYATVLLAIAVLPSRSQHAPYLWLRAASLVVHNTTTSDWNSTTSTSTRTTIGTTTSLDSSLSSSTSSMSHTATVIVLKTGSELGTASSSSEYSSAGRSRPTTSPSSIGGTPQRTTVLPITSSGGSAWYSNSSSSPYSAVNETSRNVNAVPTAYSTAPLSEGYYYTTTLSAYGTAPGTTATRNLTRAGYLSTASSSTAESAHVTCGKPTLNVYSASLDWWYTQTLYYAVSTFSIQYNSNDTRTGWTLLPATTSFDLSAALATETCTSSRTTEASYSGSLDAFSCFPAPTPVAAATIVITQTAFKAPSATTGTGNIPNVIVTPPPASITIGSFPTTFSEGTPVVYFSTYEIIRKSATTYENGSVGCAASTQEYPMATPFGFAYAGPNPDGSTLVGAGVTGDVNPALLGLVGQTTAVAGSWVADPTVVFVVQEVFAAQAVLAFATKKSGTRLLTPTPTLPSFLSPVTPWSGQKPPATNTAGGVETTASFLLIPSPAPKPPPKPPAQPGPTSPAHKGGGRKTTNAQFVGKSRSRLITVNVPVNPTQAFITAAFGNHGTLTATRLSTPTQGVFASFISAVLGQNPKPTNALQVLTQAEKTFPNRLPTKGVPEPASVRFTQANKGAPQTMPAIHIGSRTFIADSSTHFHLGPSATLTPGGTAVFQGTTLSLLPGGVGFVVQGRTQPVEAATVTPPPIVIIGGHSYTADEGSAYLIAGQTLTPGGIITANSDQTISLMSGATAIVVNDVTQPVPGPMITPAPVITVGGHPYTATSGSTYIIAGETLTPGGLDTVTIQGTTYVVSLESSGTVLVVETEGPNGQVTATTYETITAAADAGSTITSTFAANGPTVSGSVAVATSASGSQTQSAVPVLQNGASQIAVQVAAVLVAFGSSVCALWL